MLPVLKKLKDLTLLNLLPLLSYGAKGLTESFDQFMTIKIFSNFFICTSEYIFVRKEKHIWSFFMTIFAVSLGSSSFIVL